MAFDFPASPTAGQVFAPTQGTTYIWNGYAWVLQGIGVITTGTPANDQVAVWTNPTTLEGESRFTFNSLTCELKVSNPGGQVLRIRPREVGVPQVQVTPDETSVMSDVGLLLGSKGGAGVFFYTNNSGVSQFQFLQCAVAHNTAAGYVQINGGDGNTNIQLQGGGAGNRLTIKDANLIGEPTVPIPLPNDDSTRVASTEWVRDITLPFDSTPQSGRLTRVSNTSLKFAPYRGCRIRINGKNYVIPDIGIAGLNGFTGVFVNGVAGNLVIGTVYYVYCFVNVVSTVEVLTADFSTTGHVTDTGANNAGVEIKSGDSSRTLIGMVIPTTGPAWMDDTTFRFVRSWFNRVPLWLNMNYNFNLVSSAYVAMANQVFWLNWADEVVMVTNSGSCFSDCSTLVPGFISSYVGIDGTNGVYTAASFHVPGVNWIGNLSGAGSMMPQEGVLHNVQLYAQALNGTGTLYGNINVTSSLAGS